MTPVETSGFGKRRDCRGQGLSEQLPAGKKHRFQEVPEDEQEVIHELLMMCK